MSKVFHFCVPVVIIRIKMKSVMMITIVMIMVTLVMIMAKLTMVIADIAGMVMTIA